MSEYQPKEVVWAKVRGYPWWPAYIAKLPSDNVTTYKVIFFNQQNYADLEPKCVQKFAEHYDQYSKTKAKKFARALEQANNNLISNRLSSEGKSKRVLSQPKIESRQQLQHEQVSLEEESVLAQVCSHQQAPLQESLSEESKEECIEAEVLEVDRRKLEKIQAELSDIVGDMRESRGKEWKHGKYFENFQKNHDLNAEEIINSTVTKTIRYIIENMKKLKIDPKQIQKMEAISTQLKQVAMNYLTDTTYYDQYIRLIDRAKTNKTYIRAQIIKTVQHRFQGEIKKQFVQVLADMVSNQVGKLVKFPTRVFVAELKGGKHDALLKAINSKVAAQRAAERMLKRQP